MAKHNRRQNLGKRVDQFLKQTFPSGLPQKRSVTIGGSGVTVNETQALVIRKTPIMWGIPCDEMGFSKFWIIFEKHGNRMPWDGWAASEGTYLPKARNTIHDGFVDDPQKTPYLMMLDSDILFPANIVEKLMAHNLPIVGGWYKDKKAEDHHPVVFDFVEEDEKGIVHWKHREKPGEGLEKVDGMGAGCWLMRRDVAEALGHSPYDLNSGGEDMKLSRLLMKLNIPLYVDWSINCAHVGVGFY